MLRFVLLASAVLGLALPVTPVRAQVILNVERLQAGDRSGFYGAVSGSGSATGGNTDVVQVRLNVGGGFLGSRHWPRLFAGAELLRSGSGRIVDDRFAHLRYSYLFGPRLRSFHFLQIQSNRSLRVERRVLLGSGVRANIPLHPAVSFDLGSGLMHEDEVLDEDRLPPGTDVETGTLRLTNLLVWRWRPGGGVELLNVTYHQPALDDLGDFRLLDDLTLTVPLSGGVTVDASLVWRHDSRPPLELDSDDVRLTVGFSVVWGGR